MRDEQHRTASGFIPDHWAKVVPGLKPVADATGIRERLSLAFEYAEGEPDPAERRRLLTCVVVGGGAEGVAMAEALAGLRSRTLSQGLYSIAPEEVQVVLVEAGLRLLPGLDAELADRTSARLAELGVAVHLRTEVTAIAADHIVAGTERIEARTAIWANGTPLSGIALLDSEAQEEAGFLLPGLAALQAGLLRAGQRLLELGRGLVPGRLKGLSSAPV